MTKGVLLLLISALSFALSTVFVKLTTSSSDIPAIELTFFRFIAGFLFISFYVRAKKKDLIPRNIKYVAMRAVFNTLAVVFFFLGIEHTTVTKANMLNMTYPIFVFLISPFLNREKTPHLYYFYLILTMAGLYYIVIPGTGTAFSQGINSGDLFSLASGIIAALAITSLRQSRKYDDSYLILFYLMAFGAASNLMAVIPVFVVPRGVIIFYVIATVVTSLVGQLTITEGYRHISASAGALVSSNRIVFALILGVAFLGETLTLRIIIGGALILISLAGVSGTGRGLFVKLVKNKGHINSDA